MNIAGALITRALLAFIRLYQLCISPWLGASCRFHPTCSAYASQALTLYGPLRGSFLAFRRLLRCHPFTRPGEDPVPTEHAERNDHRPC